MNITELIPQRPPIVMVDSFIGIDNGLSTSMLCIRHDNIFVEDNCFTEFGIIEHIAQSAAARVGYVCKFQNKPIAIGYIGSISNFEVYSLPQVGDIITTEIEIVQEVFNITLICAKTYNNDNLIASCNMKIFLDV